MSLKSLAAKANKRAAEAIPAGFKTATQWAAAEDISVSHANKLLHTLRHTTPPLIESRNYRICVDGVLRKVPHYKKVAQ